MTLTDTTGRNQVIGAAFLALAMAAVIAIVLWFQYYGGYRPCELCLKERVPYYVGIPLMLAALVAGLMGMRPAVTRGLLAAGAVLMLAGAGLSIYHAGVEWHFWPGPDSCTGGSSVTNADAGSLLADLNAITPPSCDVAAGRFLGLSFSGWNVVSALILAAIATRCAFGAAGDDTAL